MSFLLTGVWYFYARGIAHEYGVDLTFSFIVEIFISRDSWYIFFFLKCTFVLDQYLILSFKLIDGLFFFQAYQSFGFVAKASQDLTFLW